MTTERVTYRPEGERARTVILDNVRETTFMGEPAVTGTELDRDGNQWHGTTVATQRVHVIEASLIVKRVEVRMDNTYGEFVEVAG